ncbi:MAG: type II CRISPR-associated endonuclease Cas1 [Oscillospiraceae bacterium]|jgi:CRISPR-associated protein Cas1|nr:type II CRISPR-associated endonuclease Cas1 [Oscillospiraceae bacterium]
MGFRNIMIMGDVTLSLRNNQLCVSGGNEASVPLEDVDTVLIESRRSSISTALLSEMAKSGTALFLCDEKHIPCAVLTSFMQHSRQLEVSNKQQKLSLPTKKRLWQQIVTAKIMNQARCLALRGDYDSASHLESLAKSVRTGDEGNVEAVAAAYYFPRLFGSKFRRSDENLINACLNYGYSILRGCIARHLAMYGFLPVFGLHHSSGLNAFNLADDIIEPFRPVVDLFAASNIAEADDEEEELTPWLKRELLNLINCNILLDSKLYSVSYGIERTVQSLSSVCSEKSKQLLLPELVTLQQHAYE